MRDMNAAPETPEVPYVSLALPYAAEAEHDEITLPLPAHARVERGEITRTLVPIPEADVAAAPESHAQAVSPSSSWAGRLASRAALARFPRWQEVQRRAGELYEGIGHHLREARHGWNGTRDAVRSPVPTTAETIAAAVQARRELAAANQAAAGRRKAARVASRQHRDAAYGHEARMQNALDQRFIFSAIHNVILHPVTRVTGLVARFTETLNQYAQEAHTMADGARQVVSDEAARHDQAATGHAQDAVRSHNLANAAWTRSRKPPRATQR